MSESQPTASSEPQPVDSAAIVTASATSDEEARRLRKEKKLAMKLEARARSKDKRKANKQEKKQQEKEENAKKVIESLSAPFDTSGKNSTFDADRLEMLRQLKEITEDKSRAGKVDHQILPFVATINSLRDAYTTSSCAGRTIIACSFRDASKNKKVNIKWVYLTHDMADIDAAFSSVTEYLAKRSSAGPAVNQSNQSESDSASQSTVASVEQDDGEDEEQAAGDEIWFKMEPVIVAIRIRNVATARHMLNIARTNGVKNAGIRSIGADGTVMLTLVDTYKIEALVAKDNQLLITKEYMNHLVESGNRKLVATRERFESLRQIIDQSGLPKGDAPQSAVQPAAQ